MPQTNRAVEDTAGNASDEPTAPDSPPCPIYRDVDETNIRPCYQDFDWVGLGIKFAHHQMSKGLWDKTTARKYLATMAINIKTIKTVLRTSRWEMHLMKMSSLAEGTGERGTTRDSVQARSSFQLSSKRRGGGRGAAVSSIDNTAAGQG